MKTPEEIALIGGGILLSSGLIFGLRGQASSALPNVSHSLTSISQNIDSTRKGADFDDEFKQAQQKNWQTGMWGSAKYYIDDQNNMYVGSGELQGELDHTIQSPTSLHSINLLKSVVAPQNSIGLFANLTNMQYINGLTNLDTSNVHPFKNMFLGDASLKSLDLSNFDTTNDSDMSNTFYGTGGLQKITFNNKSTFSDVGSITGTWTNGSQNVDGSIFNNGQPHPGTWYKQ